MNLMKKERYVIIVAGGKGKRMQNNIPKQFLEVGGKPLIMRSVEAFFSFDNQIKIVLVLPKSELSLWIELCSKHQFRIACKLVEGGKERFFSVKNGLKEVPNNALVAVHDGVRPFPSKATIQNTFNTADKFGNAVPVIDPVDSLRKTDEKGNILSVIRSQYKLVQTPQVFDASILKKAYEQPFSHNFTDDASVIEAIGEKIQLVEGNRENIKITTPFDLLVAESICKSLC